MKQIIITALLVLIAIAGRAQELRVNEPTLDDYLQLLKAQGYIAYSFDMKDFKDKSVEPVIMEYVDGKEPREGIVCRNQWHNISFKVINPDFLLKEEE